MSGNTVRLWVLAAWASASLCGSTVTVQVTNGAVTPFEGLLNGESALFVCDDNHDTVYNNESWQATETSLNTIIGDNGNAIPTVYFGNLKVTGVPVATKLYEEVAWLVWQFGGNSGVSSAIQNAIWDIMDQKGDSGMTISTPGYWINLAQQQIGSNGLYLNGKGLDAAQIADTEILIPQGYTVGTGGPQEFLTATPEPGTYVLFGTGLILLSLGTFRRTKRKS